MKKSNNNKVWKAPMVLFYFFLFCLLGFYARYFYLATSKVVDGKVMKEFAKNRNTASTILYAKRGTIYDNSKREDDRNTLAVNVSSYTVVACLGEKCGSRVVDKQMTAEKLSPILKMDVEVLVNLLSRKVYQVELGPGGRGIKGLVKEQIEELNLPGIYFTESYTRHYGNGDFASYVLGYAKPYEKKDETTGITNTEIVGELGIEKYFNTILKGKDGYYKYQKDRFGYKIPDTPEEKIEAVNGKDIYLTIDSQIQRFLETAVKSIEKNMKVDWTMMAVVNAKTGAILGYTASPSFDPNIKNIVNYEDPLVGRVYEPGSVMKIYTYMCAIESGKYKGNETFMSGSLSMGTDEKGKELVIRDWNRTGWGTITYDQGFARSSNVGVSYLTQKVIDKAELRECLEKYGFSAKTGIYDDVIYDVLNEKTNYEKIGNLSFNYPIEVASAAFGQRVSTNVVQQLQALTIISNNGKMLKPYIIDKIVDPITGDIVYQSKIEESETLVSLDTVNKIKDLMYSVVNSDIGTGTYYKLDGYDIIGKTGTAQVYNNKTNSYSDSVVISSFAGMFPKDDPEIIIYTATKTSSSYTSPIFSAVKDVIKNVSKTLNIYDNVNTESGSIKVTVGDYTNKNIATIKDELDYSGVDIIVLGNGNKIINQYPLKNNYLVTKDKLFLVTNSSEIEMPDMKNWSRIDVINYCNLADINYEIEGSGYVVSQSIEKGKVLTKEDKLVITLKDKITKEDS